MSTKPSYDRWRSSQPCLYLCPLLMICGPDGGACTVSGRERRRIAGLPEVPGFVLTPNCRCVLAVAAGRCQPQTTVSRGTNGVFPACHHTRGCNHNHNAAAGVSTCSAQKHRENVVQASHDRVPALRKQCCLSAIAASVHRTATTARHFCHVTTVATVRVRRCPIKRCGGGVARFTQSRYS